MNDCRPSPGSPPRPLWGKYRGQVLDNIDPLMLGRVMAEVPAVPGMLLNWAMPSTPYAGPGVGFYAIPPIGANIWVEFEGGNPDYPIWSGCFWVEGEMPLEPVVPEIKVWKTDFSTFKLNDIPAEGGASLQVIPPVAPVILDLRFDIEGIQLTCPEAAITLTPESIELTVPESSQTFTPAAIEITVPESTLTLTPEMIEMALPASSMTMTPGDMAIETPELNITAVVTIEGDVNITGAVEVEGDVNILGAVEIEGNVEIVGAVEVQGNLNFLGALEVEGDVAVVGAQEIAGDLAVAGAIEGILFGAVVPPF